MVHRWFIRSTGSPDYVTLCVCTRLSSDVWRKCSLGYLTIYATMRNSIPKLWHINAVKSWSSKRHIQWRRSLAMILHVRVCAWTNIYIIQANISNYTYCEDACRCAGHPCTSIARVDRIAWSIQVLSSCTAPHRSNAPFRSVNWVIVRFVRVWRIYYGEWTVKLFVGHYYIRVRWWSAYLKIPRVSHANIYINTQHASSDRDERSSERPQY